jgi:hypothetical protein
MLIAVNYSSWAVFKGFLQGDKIVENDLVPLMENFIHSCADETILKKCNVAAPDHTNFKLKPA